MTWLIGMLAPKLGEAVAKAMVRGLAVLILLTVLIGPYVVIYLKLQSSEKAMVELRGNLHTEATKRIQLAEDLAAARSTADRAERSAEALSRSLTALHDRYAAAYQRLAKLEKFLATVNWTEKARKDPAGTEKLLNETIKEIWKGAEAHSGTADVH